MKASAHILPIDFNCEPFVDALTFKYLHSDPTKLLFENAKDASVWLKGIVTGCGKKLERVVSLLRRDPDNLKAIISDMLSYDEGEFYDKRIIVIEARMSSMDEANPQKNMLGGLIHDLKGMQNYLHPKDKFIDSIFAAFKPSDRDKELIKEVSISIASDMCNALLNSLERSRVEPAGRSPSR